MTPSTNFNLLDLAARSKIGSQEGEPNIFELREIQNWHGKETKRQHFTRHLQTIAKAARKNERV